MVDQDLIKDAQRLLDNGEMDDARKILTGILRSQPHNLRAWEMLAEAVGDPDKKADCYRQILNINPDNKLISFKLAELTDQPTHQPPPEVRQVVDLLREVGLDALDRQTIERFKEVGVTITVGDDGYVSVESHSRVVKVHQSSMPSLMGNLGPRDIIDRAGEPLPPDARRNCPRCDAVISSDATRCEWCSLLFSADGVPIWE